MHFLLADCLQSCNMLLARETKAGSALYGHKAECIKYLVVGRNLFLVLITFLI